ncbi:MAG TPA: hypothetical protein PLU37_14310 [Chitinophagaceae bacterium]|nr:hypothetical protein [Chitinophagaceae bacterium]MCB9055810.1 hypothetical protein [Chitinophagales bacterium]HPG12702.1 hypothetical protein [Chitinophagaceae bacterium]HRX94810.1 hypothetical protein [Chitinophagaceae bacterium]
MNKTYSMAITLDEKRSTQQAAIITAAFAAFMVALMLLWKWKLPEFEKPLAFSGIEVELNLPEEPVPYEEGGGGGGNPVQAIGQAGIAPAVPPAPGENAASKDIDDNNDPESPALTKPDVAKPNATKITNTSVVKTTPKPVVETPAPPRPKAVLGKTTTGTGKGGGSADDYEKSGGSGTGYGVGNGSGTGGGSGSGNGGGNGSGSGVGNGPKITRGDRKIVRHYSFQGDLGRAVIYANVNVSPEGVGKFVSIAKGSSTTSNAYKEAIIQYLQNIRFDKADHESMLTVQFNFRVN